MAWLALATLGDVTKMILSIGSFTLAMSFWQKHWRQLPSMFLPWPPWATRQKIETILSFVTPPSDYCFKLVPFEAHKNIFYI
jgi:hypothetical protein